MKPFKVITLSTVALLSSVTSAQYDGPTYHPYDGSKPREFTTTWYGLNFEPVGEQVGFCDGSSYFAGNITQYSNFEYNNECGGGNAPN